jgi:hypothetical protein
MFLKLLSAAVRWMVSGDAGAVWEEKALQKLFKTMNE